MTHPRSPGPRPGRAGRAAWHAAIAHTADAGFRASAPSLPALFVEAARALAEMTADVEHGATAPSVASGAAGPTVESGATVPDLPDLRIQVALQASDLPALAFGWLNRLIAEGEINRAALVDATVADVVSPGSDAEGWRLRGEAIFRGFDQPGVNVRRPPKSATFHDLAVEPAGGGWMMRAYLDM